MQEESTFDIVIIGGGLAGLTCALALVDYCKVLLVEKESFPNHKVCGEYVSNEVLPYLQSLGVDPLQHGAKQINTLEISTHTGAVVKSNLPLGGFGMSRYALDMLLYKAVSDRCTIVQDTITEISFVDEMFRVNAKNGDVFSAPHVVGAYGKRSNLDKLLNRKFIQEKSPWLAVKAHYTYDFDDTKVALHNFNGGYCGLSKVETNAVNACYLTTYASFKKSNSIVQFQNETMSANPHLAHFFKNAMPLFSEPLTISQISFNTKQPVENHMFMIGDTAGLIHPLCGNGMAMAIHSAKLFSELYLVYKNQKQSRDALELNYSRAWQENFSRRLQTGRRIQNVLLRPSLAKAAFTTARMFPSLVPEVIKKTHGTILV